MTDFWAYVLAWIIIICASVFIVWITGTAALIVASKIGDWREGRERRASRLTERYKNMLDTPGVSWGQLDKAHNEMYEARRKIGWPDEE